VRVLFSGILFFIAGLFFILHKFYGAAILAITVPVLIILGGIYALYLSINHRANARYFLTGVFLFLLGVFFIFSNIILPDVGFMSMWPAFMLLFGIVLFIYSMCKRPRQINILVPSVAIMIMAVVFIPFSFKIITVSLFKFVATWWPIIFILVGVMLLAVYFVSCFKRTNSRF